MHVPTVLTGVEVERGLSALTSERHRAVVMLAYGAGLRIGEACRLRVEDIDAKRMLLHVRNAKRGRERYVMLSPRLLKTLRAYWKSARLTGTFVFPGPHGTRPERAGTWGGGSRGGRGQVESVRASRP